jgi:hypothetical protein
MAKQLGTLRIHMKNPDCVSVAVDEAVERAGHGLDLEDEAESLAEVRRERINNALRKFVEYGEYITVEIDMDAQTARVIPVRG